MMDNNTVKINNNLEKIFDLSMGKEKSGCYTNYTKTPTNKKMYEFFRNLFCTNFNVSTESVKVKIPKIIHQIWLGKKEIPHKFINYMSSWKTYNPTWQYKLWTDEDLTNFNFQYLEKYFDISNNIGQKADIFRYEILYQHGGLYVDTDFECLKSFDQLNYSYDFYCGLHPPHQVIYPDYPLEIGNALIASVKNHPILLETFRIIEKEWHRIYSSNDYDDNWKVVLSTMFPLRDAIIHSAYEKGLHNIAMPATYFFPFLPHRYIKDPSCKNEFQQKEYNSMAIHHWGESWFYNS